MFTLVLMMIVGDMTNPQAAMTSVQGFSSRNECEIVGNDFETEFVKRHFYGEAENPDFFKHDTVGVMTTYKTYFSYKCVEVK